MDSLGSVANYTQPIHVNYFDLNGDISKIVSQIGDSIKVNDDQSTSSVEKTMAMTIVAIEITKLYNELAL
jgi:hypothetical protein